MLVSSVLPGALAALADEALLKDALRVVVGGTSGVSSVVQQVGARGGYRVWGGEGVERGEEKDACWLAGSVFTWWPRDTCRAVSALHG